jgi:hypothetical protein
MWSVPRLYNEIPRITEAVSRLALQGVEAGSNTTTVALRVVGGNETGTQCLGV